MRENLQLTGESFHFQLHPSQPRTQSLQYIGSPRRLDKTKWNTASTAKVHQKMTQRRAHQ